jgi:hypothetical protein
VENRCDHFAAVLKIFSTRLLFLGYGSTTIISNKDLAAFFSLSPLTEKTNPCDGRLSRLPPKRRRVAFGDWRKKLVFKGLDKN